MNYIEKYKEFLDSYQSGITDGSKVGETISVMASYYTNVNLDHAAALINFNSKAREIEESTDDNGKPISSSKAKVKSLGTLESNELIRAKTAVENVEQIINALKSLQKGLLFEKGHSGMM